MSNHPWCSDIARDTAIRAAEDAAASERPPLPDHRELPERVARLEEEMALARAAARLNASAAAVTESRSAAPRTEETSQSGLRTERVTLEVQYNERVWEPAGAWSWCALLKDRCRTVRVVPSSEADAEVERLRTEVAVSPCFSRRSEMAEEALRWCIEGGVPPTPVNIVTALFSLGLVALPSEASLPDVSDQDGDRVSTDWPGLAKVLQAERDAALSSRDASLAFQAQAVAERDAAIRERDAALARVAELEKRSSFLSQHKEAWAYETMLDGCEIGSREWAESDPELHWIKLTAQENGNANGSEGDRSRAGCVRCVGAGEMGVLDGDAQYGGEVNKRPVAWLHQGLDSVFLFPNEELKSKCVPLYRAPPPPRGWLTEEERKLLRDAHLSLVCKSNEAFNASRSTAARQYANEANMIEALLARNSPPRVRLPADPECSTMADYGRAWRECSDAVREALAAAGVEVIE